jgi:hypothetical protein
MPLICDVYCLTAGSPPAFAAPATNARENPRRLFASALRSFPVNVRKKCAGMRERLLPSHDGYAALCGREYHRVGMSRWSRV